eukprot:scaffold1190_cov393-Prasinococcus_capsulatus_cf.AAC.27
MQPFRVLEGIDDDREFLVRLELRRPERLMPAYKETQQQRNKYKHGAHKDCQTQLLRPLLYDEIVEPSWEHSLQPLVRQGRHSSTQGVH